MAKVKYIRQPDGFSCGPTCIKMVAEFIKGKVPSIPEICDLCGTDTRTGTPPEKMINGLDSLKIQYVVHSKEIEPIQSLKNIINRNHVALLRTITKGVPHWIVAIDYNEDVFIINDPWLGEIEYDYNSLLRIWAPRDYYYFEIITGQKKQAKGDVLVRPMTNADIKTIYPLLAKIFNKTGLSSEEVWVEIEEADPDNNSFVVEVDGNLAGFYFIGSRQIPEGGDGYNELKDLIGVEGIALGVLPEYKNMGIGKILIDHSRKNLGADYIWGYQLKSLKNIDDWLKRRKIYYQNNFLYITYEILN